VKALATYAYIEGGGKYYVEATLSLLGLLPAEVEKISQEIDAAVRSYLEGDQRSSGERWAKLKEVAIRCLDELDIVGEAKKRLSSMTEDELKVLRIAALGIMKRVRAGAYWNRFNPYDLAKFVSVMLLRDVDADYLERLFARALLAVKSGSEMSLVPNAFALLKELAEGVAGEYPSYSDVYSKLRYSMETYQVASLLNPHGDFYEAVYGRRYEDVLKSLAVEKIVYRGVVNEYVKDEIEKAAKDLAQEYCHKLMVNYVVDALEKAGYDVDLKDRGFSEYEYYCRYAAVKPGANVYAYVVPFAVRPPSISSDERAIIVVEGPGANLPKYLESLRQSSSYYRVLADTLWIAVYQNRVYVFTPPRLADWQQEIVEALKAVHQQVSVISITGKPEEPEKTSATTRQVVEPVQPPTPTICSNLSGPVRTRDVLESIVAQALKALGFEVQTDVYRPAKKGANIEVDVWAEKRVGDARFRVYVSCKNWDRDVDSSIVNEEFGRVLNLQEVPHLRILVVKSMTKPAKEVAEADGFFVIELGDKATELNAKDVCENVYKRLSDIFTGIAPPQLIEIARRVKETAEELSRIAQRLVELSKQP